MSDSGMESTPTPTHTLQHLEQSRQILQRLIRVARLIEGLKHSLEHMLAQDSVTTGEDPQMARLIEGLGDKILSLSDGDVTLRLERLDQRLRTLFNKLSPLIDQIQVADTPVSELPLSEAVQDIGDLKRSARTALAMRGLLARRGVAVPDFRLPLDRNRLQQQLQSVTHEERSARRQVIEHVLDVDGEIRRLLKHGNLPEAMRDLLQRMLDGLQENLDHLEAGQSVGELPLPIEDVSFIEPQRSEAAKPSALSPADSGGDERDAQPREPSQDPARGTTEAPPPPGLFRSIRLWILSPWNVSWRDIRSGRYRA
ncbi:MAG: hypothetical protein R3175_05065 [Marinobacter sp.]|uniref:hypothetical protein n=1 Tax=Marinobacter sp. TaxID=50741 RepID=UPI00299E3273|nr:hypothetical protein [Marinobacter sp.]MDX1755413.1 hypothetical protein [Marinobacter sp.]